MQEHIPQPEHLQSVPIFNYKLFKYNFMIARNLFKYMSLTAAIVLLFSCNKSFLNKIPESSLTTGNFPQSAIDAESELTGAYDWMVFYTNFYQYDNYFNTDGKSDNCYLNSDNVSAEQPLEYFSTVTASNTNIQRDWQELYNDIRAANAVLDDVPNISDPGLTSARK